RRRHTRSKRDWSSDVCSSDLAVFATEMGKLVYKLTRVDIIVTPLVTIFTGFYIGKFIGIPVGTFMIWFGEIINWSTTQRPIIMGVLVAVLMGWSLTAPI